MLLTIKELIEELKKHQKIHGGNAPIAIDDADTGWHMKIGCVRESNRVKGRLLIAGAGYSEKHCLKT